MIQEIINYKNIVSAIEELIDKSPFKKNYIIEQVGIPAPSFYRKLKMQSFTPDEMLSIAKVLSPEEVYIMELKESIKRGKEDYKNGRFSNYEDAVNEIKKELNML